MRHFVRPTALLFSSNLCGYLLALIAVPLLSRLYSPDEFGAYSTFLSALTLALFVTSLRYEAAIVLARLEINARALFKLVWWINCATCLLVSSGVSLAFGPYYGGIFGLTLFCAARQQSYTAWNLRATHYRLIAKSKIVQSLMTIFGQVLFHMVPGGLLVAEAAGRLGGNLTSKSLTHIPNLPIAPLRLLVLAKKYASVTLASSLSGLINTLGLSFSLILISYYFDLHVAGLFGLALMILQAPTAVVGQAVARVFLSLTSKHPYRTQEHTLYGVVHLSKLALIPASILFVHSELIIRIVFGEAWYEASLFLQALLPWCLLVFICAPFSSLTLRPGLQRMELFFQFFIAAARVFTVVVFQSQGAEITAIIFGTVNAIGWMVFLLWHIRLSGNSVTRYLRLVAAEGAAAIVVLSLINAGLPSLSDVAAFVLISFVALLALCTRIPEMFEYEYHLGFQKRAFDIIGSVFLLIILMPIIAFIPCLILLENRLTGRTGSVFYAQRRLGYQLKEFKIYKFRTMSDEKVTAVGRWLRPSGLDELPQILNIFYGEMSLVGPRPLRSVDIYRLGWEDKEFRCQMKPGFTGLAQLSTGQGAAHTLKSDKTYFYTASLWRDLEIVVKSILTLPQNLLKQVRLGRIVRS